MSIHESVERDERTAAVENASYKWAYVFTIFAISIDVMYRAFLRHEMIWDLVAVIFVSSAISKVYQVRQKTLGPGFVWKGQERLWKAAIIAYVVLAIGFAILAVFIMIRGR